MGGSSTQRTEIPDATPQEQELMDMYVDQLLPAYLEASGYVAEKKEIQWEDTDEYKTYQTQKADLQAQIDEGAKRAGLTPGNQAGQMGVARLRQKMEELDAQAAEKAKGYPVTSFDTRERESYAAEEARKKYGENSEEYKAEHQKWMDQNIELEEGRSKLAGVANEKALKYLNGDFSITPEQKALISENMAPVKAAVESMFKDTEEKTIQAYSQFKTEVGKTKMNVMDALSAVGNQILKTGAKMEESLKSVVETNRKLLEIGIKDYSGELTKKIAADATAMGRSPDDPEYTKSIADSVSKQIKEGTLNLASMEAQGQLNIDERTGSNLEKLGMAKADIEQAFGMTIAGATKEEGLARADLASGRGSAMTGIAQDEANLRWQVGAGMPPSQIQTGQSAAQYNEAILKTRLANASAATSGVMAPVSGYYLPQRTAQPTTTTESSGNWWDYLQGGLGLVSAGANIYSGVQMGGMLRDSMKASSSYRPLFPGTGGF